MKKYNTFESCYFGMESIFNNAPNPKLIDKKVIKELKDKSFNIDKNLHARISNILVGTRYFFVE